MLDEELRETQLSLRQVGKACRKCVIATKVSFVIFFIFWLIAAGSMLLPFFERSFSILNSDTNVFSLILHIARGAIVVMLFLILIRILKEPIRGESPFTMRQVERLKAASAMLLIYAILEAVLGYCSALVQIGDFSAGYISSDGVTNAIMPINFAPFIAAAVVFAFSFVFKYGVLLQEFSDETL